MIALCPHCGETDEVRVIFKRTQRFDEFFDADGNSIGDEEFDDEDYYPARVRCLECDAERDDVEFYFVNSPAAGRPMMASEAAALRVQRRAVAETREDSQ